MKAKIAALAALALTGCAVAPPLTMEQATAMPAIAVCQDYRKWAGFYNGEAVDRPSIERRLTVLDSAIKARGIDCVAELAILPPPAESPASRVKNCFPNQFTGGITCL